MGISLLVRHLKAQEVPLVYPNLQFTQIFSLEVADKMLPKLGNAFIIITCYNNVINNRIYVCCNEFILIKLDFQKVYGHAHQGLLTLKWENKIWRKMKTVLDTHQLSFGPKKLHQNYSKAQGNNDKGTHYLMKCRMEECLLKNTEFNLGLGSR